jgi:hypothetical protein
VIYDNISYGSGVTIPFDFTLETAVEEIKTITGSKLYPNPAAEEVFVEFNADKATEIELTVVDMMGRIVATPGSQSLTEGHNKISIDVADLVGGSYFIRMKEAKAVSTIKFDKM